ncbi:MAG TPA: alpha/beta hydrolase [Caulobacteraceae bacterium]|nr:alpha/beta hydrolase [Caulobacteraceae bacterium]
MAANEEHSAASVSRRLLLDAGLLGATLMVGGAAKAADAGGSLSAVHHGANNPLPPAALSANAAMFPGFRQAFTPTRGVMVDGKLAQGAVINTLIGGKGPPLLLIHGHPETHVCWHRIAGKLAERFTVVMTDLRGYGDSSKPDGGEDHINYAKRAMGADQVQVMQSLGFNRFQAVGHDRGGRVLQFMMLDHPEAVARGVVLDIAPTDLMYAQTDKSFATRYFWWFFQIQDAPLPERFIGALPGYYVESHLAIQNKTPGAVTPAALAAYIRTYSEPAAIHAVCEDYRAAAGIDSQLLTMARTAGHKMTPPLLAIWGAKGTVGREFDVIRLWKQEAVTVSGHPLPCGHLIPEEDPSGLLASLDTFLTL